MVGPSQPHLISIELRPTSDPDVTNLVSVNRRLTSDLDIVVYPTLSFRPPDGLPILDSTDERSITSWTWPHMDQATTTAAYNLTPTHMVWPRLYDPSSLPGLGATYKRLCRSASCDGKDGIANLWSP